MLSTVVHQISSVREMILRRNHYLEPFLQGARERKILNLFSEFSFPHPAAEWCSARRGVESVGGFFLAAIQMNAAAEVGNRRAPRRHSHFRSSCVSLPINAGVPANAASYVFRFLIERLRP